MLFAAIWVVLFILIAVLAWNLTPEQFEDIQAAKQWLGFKGYSVVLLEGVEVVPKGAYSTLIDDYCGVRKELYRVIEEREELDRKLQALQRVSK